MIWEDLDQRAEENSGIFNLEDIEGRYFPPVKLTREEEKEIVRNAERARLYGNRINHLGYIFKTNYSKKERKIAKKELRKVYRKIDDNFIRVSIKFVKKVGQIRNG